MREPIIPIPNLRRKPARIAGKDILGHPRILAGKMTHPDTLSWSPANDGSTLLLTGLWRGNPRYGEVEVSAKWLLDTYKANGFTDEAQSLERAMQAWAKPLTA